MLDKSRNSESQQTILEVDRFLSSCIVFVIQQTEAGTGGKDEGPGW